MTEFDKYDWPYKYYVFGFDVYQSLIKIIYLFIPRIGQVINSNVIASDDSMRAVIFRQITELL